VRELAQSMPAPPGHLDRWGPSLDQYQAAQQRQDAEREPDAPTYRAEVVPDGPQPGRRLELEAALARAGT
jgi:hypothetical protein